MAEIVTLELPETLARRASEVANRTNRRLVLVSADDFNHWLNSKTLEVLRTFRVFEFVLWPGPMALLQPDRI